MNHGNMPRTFLALGAIFLTVLAAAGCGINTMPTKDVWFTQHYIIMQDFEQREFLERELPAAVEHRPVPGLSPQRQSGLD
jgi:hypothetical protein